MVVGKKIDWLRTSCQVHESPVNIAPPKAEVKDG
jgi:hypothetical protein